MRGCRWMLEILSSHDYSNNPQWHMHGKPDACKGSNPDSTRPCARTLSKAAGRRLSPGKRSGQLEDSGEAASIGTQISRSTRLLGCVTSHVATVNWYADFVTHFQDRILYATDFSLREGDALVAARSYQTTHDRDWQFFSGDAMLDYAGHRTRGLALPDIVLRKIFRENALRWIPGLNA